MRRFFWIAIFMAALVGGYLFFSTPAYPIRNAPTHSGGGIVAMGDSLTQGLGAPPGATYPDDLARLIGRPVANAGVTGNTIAEAHARFAAEIFSRRPAIVIVLLGANDAFQHKDLDQSFAELERAVTEIQAHGAMVVLLGLEGLTPFSGFGARYAGIARRTGSVLVPDIMGGLLGHSDLMSDEIHPNAAGYEIMAERVAAKLRPYL